MKNIVFIGMPASGKTTVSKILSKKLKKNYYDTDKYIEQMENISIKEIFLEKGEEYFRDLEEKYTKILSEMESVIISTGGGAIKRENNIKHLKKNGIIIFIDRNIEDISKENHKRRPLLQNPENIKKLHDERYHLYKKYADIIVKNNSNLDVLSNKIVHILKKRKIIKEKIRGKK